MNPVRPPEHRLDVHPSHIGSSFASRPRAITRWRLLACAATVAAMAACGGSGSESAPPPAAPTGTGPLKAVSQPGEFTQQIKALLNTRRAFRETPITVSTSSTTASAAGAASPTNFSTTTRVESGVDEDDLVKTDGQRLYALASVDESLRASTRLTVHRRQADGSLLHLQSQELVKTLDLEQPIGLMLASDVKRLVSMRRVSSAYAGGCPADTACPALSVAPSSGASTSVVAGRVDTHIALHRLNDDGVPSVATNVQMQGTLVGSRRIDNTLYLVSQHHPWLAAEWAATQAERDAALADLQDTQVLPSVSVDGGAEAPLVRGEDCYVQPGNGSRDLVITTVTAVDLAADGFRFASRCFMGGTEALYLSPRHLYLATSRWTPPTQDAQGRWVYPSAELFTDVHKFSVQGMDVTYRATGQVPGHLGWARDGTTYRMSEHNDDLRVLSFTGTTGWALATDSATTTPASPATLTILRESTATQRLNPVGSLPNARRPAAIGEPGEQVYAVRFFGDRGYVVTFRQVDPLYVLDLSDPTDPRQLGALKVEGFSSDLYPMANGLLLGVGRAATPQGQVLGVKVSLFDVADPAQPTELMAHTLGASGSWTALDASPRGIALLPRGDVTRVALPMLTTVVPWSPQTATHALQRFEVDTRARTLRLLTAVGAPPSQRSYVNLSNERAIIFDEHVYYYSEGMFTVSRW